MLRTCYNFVDGNSMQDKKWKRKRDIWEKDKGKDSPKIYYSHNLLSNFYHVIQGTRNIQECPTELTSILHAIIN
jgi:hypothetical protein